MRLKIFLEHRFKRTPDGQVWSPIFAYDAWTRYHRVFSEIVVCARVADVAAVGKDVAPVLGDRVTVAALPYYHGPWQYLLKRAEFRPAVSALIEPGDAYIVRVPGNVANQAIAALNAAETPYAIEAVADPWDMFSPGSSTHPLRWFFRKMFWRSMRQQCAGAAVSLYVTEYALQRRYPPKSGSQSFHASNVFLSAPPRTSTHAVSDVCLVNSAFAEGPRTPESFSARPVRFVCVGSFNLLYKAQDVLVNALAKAVKQGLDAHLTFVGDGVYRPRIEMLVRKYARLQNRVEFLGQLRGGAAVRDVLDRSHIFVLPSRQEGLPRAALEAMARGLPCIGSEVGGFPEILQPDAIVPTNNVCALAAAMLRLTSDPARLAEISASNLARAADFHADKLAVRQNAYYAAVRHLFSDFWTHRDAGLRSPVSSDTAAASRSEADELAFNRRQAA